MINKGYRYPLMSLNLLGPRQEFPDESVYSITVPEGSLVISKALRKRAEGLTTQQTEVAVNTALAAHGIYQEGLSRYGLSRAWAEGMRHWSKRLSELETEWTGMSGDLSTVRQDRRGLRQSAVVLWRQLALTSRLAHVEPPVSGGPPRGEQGLLTGLEYAIKLLRRPTYAVLGSRGFGKEDRVMLRKVVGDLRGLAEEELKLVERRRKVSGMILVVRGALIGDVIHLSKAAQMVIMDQKEKRNMQVGRLLGV
jgi:hypothetical protein